MSTNMVFYRYRIRKRKGETIAMDKLRLLIAEGSEEFRIALADALRGVYHVRQCAEGNEAMALLQSFQPDVMVLDLMLPGLDGITLLQRAVDAGIRPTVLATTRFVNDYVMDSVDRLAVGYLMVKPCDVRATIERLGDLSSRIRKPQLTRPEPRTHVSNLLLSLGVPTKLRGYSYLREAILLWQRDPGQSITKELYPAVAELCGCASVHVERSIRSAITAAWSHREEHLWRMFFPADASGDIPKPSNGTFIARLADCLRTDYFADGGNSRGGSGIL